MRPEGVAAAQRELKRALRAHRHFVSSSQQEEAEDAYDAFLTHAGRIYAKLRAACHGQGVDWMWWKSKMDERRDDPLLLYIHKARNADTHRLENSVAWHDAQGPIAFLTLIPLPVSDQDGTVYHPPTVHAGHNFGFMTVGMIIDFGAGYLEALVAEAGSRLR